MITVPLPPAGSVVTELTRGMIGARELGLLRPGAVLINTARGAVVDERALVDAVLAGRIHAGLDVFWDEPEVPPALRRCENVLLSPHAGSATASTREAMTRLCVDNVRAVVSGRVAAHLVPEQRGLFDD